MSEERTDLLLFDLGRVVVEVTGERDIRRYLSSPLKPDGRWPAMDIWDEFERGLLEPDEFSRRFVAQLALNIEPDAFLVEFESWTKGLMPGAAETLAALRSRFRLAALSNSNVLHWRRNDALRVFASFDHAFSSHQLGMRKPAPEIYEYVLRELDVLPEAVTFFDDLEPNVEAAKQLGMQAHRVEGIDELRACLREIGFLD